VMLEGRRATGIEFVQKGRTEQVGAAREVILCAGAFNTPQLLMLSGVGPADHLESVGVKTVIDLPAVGANLQDHLGIWITWKRKNPGTFHREMRLDRMTLNMIQAYFFGTGAGTVVPGGLHAFVKTQAGLDVPDIEFMFHTVPPQTRLWLPLVRPAYQDAYAIRPTLLHPVSRGHIRLRSADPRDPVKIMYNFFSAPEDLHRLREGFKRARDVGEQAAMEDYRALEANPGPKVKTDAEIDAYIRRTAMTAHHPSSTCRMGHDDRAALDPQMRVRGIEGLRVVDASAMPDLVSAHINACVLMMAEKASDIIKEAA